MGGSFTPPYYGFMDDVEMKLDKSTMDFIRLQTSGNYGNMPYIMASSYSYKYIEEPLYPYVVGKESKVVETSTDTILRMAETEKTTETNTYVYKVEKIEDIAVPAGTFRCFKVVEYYEDGTLSSTSWFAEETKFYPVKELDHETGEIAELVSYSVSSE